MNRRTLTTIFAALAIGGLLGYAAPNRDSGPMVEAAALDAPSATDPPLPTLTDDFVTGRNDGPLVTELTTTSTSSTTITVPDVTYTDTYGDEGGQTGTTSPPSPTTTPTTAPPTPSTTTTTVPAATRSYPGQYAPGHGTHRTLLDHIPIRAEASDAGYDRDKWGWWDPDGNQCNTRCEVLAAERRPDGTWFSIWDGEVTSDPGDLHIDHIVPLYDMYVSLPETYRVDDAKMRRVANETRNLQAVTASSNIRKSAKGPDEWLPSNEEAVCPFVYLWVEFKTSSYYSATSSWGSEDPGQPKPDDAGGNAWAWMSADKAEWTALANLLDNRCP